MVRRHHWLNGYELSKLQELVMDTEAWCVCNTMQALTHVCSHMLSMLMLTHVWPLSIN